MNAKVAINQKIVCTNCPVLNPRLSRTTSNLSMNYILDCGNDNICTSDLNLQVSTDLQLGNRYVIGSKSKANIGILTKNFGEPAYRAQLHLKIPEPILLARLPSQCHEEFHSNKSFKIICDIGNPLRLNVSI